MKRVELHQQYPETELRREKDGSLDFAGRRYAPLRTCAHELGLTPEALEQTLGLHEWKEKARRLYVVPFVCRRHVEYFPVKRIHRVVRDIARDVARGIGARPPAKARKREATSLPKRANDPVFPPPNGNAGSAAARGTGLVPIGGPMIFEPGVGMRPVTAEDVAAGRAPSWFGQLPRRRRRRPVKHRPRILEALEFELSPSGPCERATYGHIYLLKRKRRTIAVLGPLSGDAPDGARIITAAVLCRHPLYYLERAAVGHSFVVKARRRSEEATALLGPAPAPKTAW